MKNQVLQTNIDQKKIKIQFDNIYVEKHNKNHLKVMLHYTIPHQRAPTNVQKQGRDGTRQNMRKL